MCSFVTIDSACDEGFAGLEIGGRDGLEAQGREKEPLRTEYACNQRCHGLAC